MALPFCYVMGMGYTLGMPELVESKKTPGHDFLRISVVCSPVETEPNYRLVKHLFWSGDRVRKIAGIIRPKLMIFFRGNEKCRKYVREADGAIFRYFSVWVDSWSIISDTRTTFGKKDDPKSWPDIVEQPGSGGNVGG